MILELRLLLTQLDKGYDLVLGSRNSSRRQVGAMPLQAVWGNWLATWMMRLFLVRLLQI